MVQNLFWKPQSSHGFRAIFFGGFKTAKFQSFARSNCPQRSRGQLRALGKWISLVESTGDFQQTPCVLLFFSNRFFHLKQDKQMNLDDCLKIKHHFGCRKVAEPWFTIFFRGPSFSWLTFSSIMALPGLAESTLTQVDWLSLLPH